MRSNSISDWVALGLLFGPSWIIHLDQNLAITISYTEILMRKIDYSDVFFTGKTQACQLLGLEAV